MLLLLLRVWLLRILRLQLRLLLLLLRFLLLRWLLLLVWFLWLLLRGQCDLARLAPPALRLGFRLLLSGTDGLPRRLLALTGIHGALAVIARG